MKYEIKKVENDYVERGVLRGLIAPLFAALIIGITLSLEISSGLMVVLIAMTLAILGLTVGQAFLAKENTFIIQLLTESEGEHDIIKTDTIECEINCKTKKD